jgi:hypothetical protein
MWKFRVIGECICVLLAPKVGFSGTPLHWRNSLVDLRNL